jgi:hypothetical protein
LVYINILRFLVFFGISLTLWVSYMVSLITHLTLFLLWFLQGLTFWWCMMHDAWGACCGVCAALTGFVLAFFIFVDQSALNFLVVLKVSC